MPTFEQREEINWALDALLPYQSGYIEARNYYQGRHKQLMDETRRAKIFARHFKSFRLNLCKPVVDSLTDRLQISSFSAKGQEKDEARAMEVYERCDLDLVADEVHEEAVATGDSYVIVWPEPESQAATIYPHDSNEVAVEYDAEKPGVITRAAKLWKPDKDTVRLNLYYPDRLERYVSRRQNATGSQLPSSQYADPNYQGASAAERSDDWDTHLYGGTAETGDQFLETGSSAGHSVNRAEAFDYFEDSDEPGGWTVENPYGTVPVFHFANGGKMGRRGISELHDAIPVQDALNKEAFDLLVGSEFQAFRQRWATGVEVPRDADGNPINPFTSGPDKVWIAGATDGTEAKFGEFGAADLNQLDNVKRSFALDMAQVTQTPPHYFFSASNLVSGESQKTAEQKLDAKVFDRQRRFGKVWARVIGLAVRMDRGLEVDGLELQTNWTNTKPRNQKEDWEVMAIKEKLNVPWQQLLMEQGYSRKQIEEFEAKQKERQAEQQAQFEAQARAGTANQPTQPQRPARRRVADLLPSSNNSDS